MGWLMNQSRRAIALAVLACVVLLGGCGGPSATWPETTCTPDLAVGTPCLPSSEHLGAEQFVDVSTYQQALDAMSTGTASVTSTRCTELPGVWAVCISNHEGILAITGVDVPDGARATFVGSDLDEVEPISVRVGETVGIRRDTGVLSVLLLDSDEAPIGEVNLGFYG